MKLKIIVLLAVLYFPVSKLKSQCSNFYNYSNTITGTYTGAINSNTFSTFYIAPNSTVTGNIDLNHAQLYNCGVIINQKIRIKNVTDPNKGSIDNRGLIITDTLIVDTLGDLHNHQTINSQYILSGFKANITNQSTINTYTLIMNDSSSLDNYQPYCKIITETTRFNNSWAYNMGLIYAKKIFYSSFGTIINNFCTIQVDSLFRNFGLIAGGSNTNNGSLFGTILIENKSENYGQISSLEVCDHSTINGGGFDINTGSTVGVTYCEKEPNCTTLNWVGIEENNNKNILVKIYPNPTKNKLIIEHSQNVSDLKKITVLNVLGQTIYLIEESNEKYEIDLEALPNAIYYLKIEGVEIYKVVKVIKE